MEVIIFKRDRVVATPDREYIEMTAPMSVKAEEYRSDDPPSVEVTKHYTLHVHHAQWMDDRTGYHERRFCVDDPEISQILFNTERQLREATYKNQALESDKGYLQRRVKELGDEAMEHRQTMNKIGDKNIFQLISWWRNLRKINKIVEGKK